MDPDELVGGALTLLVGGYVIWEVLKQFVLSDPAFGKAIGGAIVTAFVVGAVAWLKGR